MYGKAIRLAIVITFMKMNTNQYIQVLPFDYNRQVWLCNLVKSQIHPSPENKKCFTQSKSPPSPPSAKLQSCSCYKTCILTNISRLIPLACRLKLGTKLLYIFFFEAFRSFFVLFLQGQALLEFLQHLFSEHGYYGKVSGNAKLLCNPGVGQAQIFESAVVIGIRQRLTSFGSNRNLEVLSYLYTVPKSQ